MVIKNWRPISLINVGIKISSKALEARMKTVIHSLIFYYQTAYVKGRYIGESVRLIDDLLKYAEDENIDGIRLYVKSQNPFKMSFKLKLCSFVSVPSLFKKKINAFDSFGIE